jgi:hypothetical protein
MDLIHTLPLVVVDDDLHLYRSGAQGKMTGQNAGQIMRRRPVTFAAGTDLY